MISMNSLQIIKFIIRQEGYSNFSNQFKDINECIDFFFQSKLYRSGTF